MAGATKKAGAKKAKATVVEEPSRTRKARPYPASSFADALQLGEAIMQRAAGEKVRRLTLLQQMDKSPTSSSTKMMITNSGKYGITTGSYIAEFLELTATGRTAVDASLPTRVRRKAQFDLAIDGVAPFKLLYEHYKGKRLPEPVVMKDLLRDSPVDVPDLDECIDTFTVNAKDLGLLRTIGGAETLISVDQALDEMPGEEGFPASETSNGTASLKPVVPFIVKKLAESVRVNEIDWQKICFYITPIGSDDSDERKHSDLFLSSLVQPALEELGLTVVRADQIGDAGMITTQVLEYLKRSRLAIADLSYLNP